MSIADGKPRKLENLLRTEVKGFDTRLARNVYVLSVTMGVMSMFFGWQQFLPLYITALGAGAAEVGIFYAVTFFAHALSGIPLSIVSDRSGRKKFVVIGTYLAGFAYMSYALFVTLVPSLVQDWFLIVVPTWALLMIPMFIQQLLHAAYINPMMALLSESAPPDKRGTANGIFQAIAGAITIIAPTIAAILIGYFAGLQAAMPILFLMTGLSMVIMAGFRWAMLRETYVSPVTLAPVLTSERTGHAESNWGSVGGNDPLEENGGFRGRVMAGFYLFIILSALIANIMNIFMVIYATQVFGLQTMDVGLWMTVAVAATTLAQIPTGRFADKERKKRLLLMAVLLYAVGIPLFLNAGSFYGVIIAQIPLSVAGTLTYNTEFAMLAAYTSSKKRSTAYSLQTAIFDITSIPGPLIGGFSYQLINPDVPFILSLILTIPAFIVGLFLVREPKIVKNSEKR